MLNLFREIYKYTRSKMADAVERGITDGAAEGAQRAFARLTGGEIDAQTLLTMEPAAELIEAAEPDEITEAAPAKRRARK